MGTDYDPFEAKDFIDTNNEKVAIYRLNRLEELGLGNISKLPNSIKVLLESLLRNVDGKLVTKDDVKALAGWSPDKVPEHEIPFIPSRVLMQDFTGVPAVVDIAAMRSAMQREGGDSSRINPEVPADLVIDHSLQVDYFGTTYSKMYNEEKEFERNKERYSLLRWAQESFDNFQVVPPGKGIIHQVNLEHLAPLVHFKNSKNKNEKIAYPDTLVGTDSHTTMINGLGVLGWGVGGIEAEAVMMGQPYYMSIPEVVGFKLDGELQEGVTATDLVLTVTQMLRKHGVVGKFVEFYGPGLDKLSLPDRATLANMAPEYGATMGYFPIDEETLEYLKLTGRSEEHVNMVRKYTKEQGLFFDPLNDEPMFNDKLELDMSTVEPSIAGPKRPYDRISIENMSEHFHNLMKQTFAEKRGEKDIQENDPDYNRWLEEGGNISNVNTQSAHHTSYIKCRDSFTTITHGAVAIASITSCTNTSNPSVLIGAGLLAKNAVEMGLDVKPYVKTSLAPGSRIVTDYLDKSELLPYLEALGFHLVGYGCATCIGNSGPINESVENEIKEKDLTVAAVLSGNRNFEGRINPYIKANYLTSPMLVVAYALAGTVDIDLKNEALGCDPNGLPIYLKDIWPTQNEINQIIKNTIDSDMFEREYSHAMKGTELWDDMDVPQGDQYHWNPNSSYIQEPPFFKDFPHEIPKLKDIKGARVLAYLGDNITTDHISPAGDIPVDSPAGQYLLNQGVKEEDFNTYGSRRGNHEVMMRGTFGNIRLNNKLVDRNGGWTLYHPTGKEMSIYNAAMNYQENNIPLIVMAGKEYGTGSSRDWAAKGTQLLGVKAVIAESFERIHRSNLVGMGVLPLQFKKGENTDTLGLKGDETYDINGIENLKPSSEIEVVARTENGDNTTFKADVRLDSDIELEYYRNGGILHKFLREILNEN
ncbi:aconitate hydratase AcnA [Methanohalobium sp.]|uniref:aconitate hydratase AcnA n=1 Tax=Methanohalobium sp. TaxID=2837493 RepID=UPI0025F45447|nr:aconitate hydratase AcnA [Methanohalobium sp.]